MQVWNTSESQLENKDLGVISKWMGGEIIIQFALNNISRNLCFSVLAHWQQLLGIPLLAHLGTLHSTWHSQGLQKNSLSDKNKDFSWE